MKYFVVGLSHFFNLIPTLIDSFQIFIYLAFFVIFIILIMVNFSKVKFQVLDIIKIYLGLYKKKAFLLNSILLLLTSVIVYKYNNDFYAMTLFVLFVDFIIESLKFIDNKIFDINNNKIFKIKDLWELILPILILIFFKMTLWGELYSFDLIKASNYFLAMFIVLIIRLLLYVYSRIFTIYSNVFEILKKANHYGDFRKVIDIFTIIVFYSKNNINYFRVINELLKRQVINRKNHSIILNLCRYVKKSREYNLEPYTLYLKYWESEMK